MKLSMVREARNLAAQGHALPAMEATALLTQLEYVMVLTEQEDTSNLHDALEHAEKISKFRKSEVARLRSERDTARRVVKSLATQVMHLLDAAKQLNERSSEHPIDMAQEE